MSIPPAVRTAVAAVVAAAAACSGGADTGARTSVPLDVRGGDPMVSIAPPAPAASAPTASSTDGSAPAPVPVYPLTGLPVTDPAAAVRPAMVVKIDNNAAARPQSGLNAADLVFEEIVEFQTRLAIVLHSQVSDPVGPIRSGRTQDIDLLSMLGHPLFVWSGGNANVTRAIDTSDLRDLSALDSAVWAAGGFYRADGRAAPHDEYAESSRLWTLADADAGPPSPVFTFLAAGASPTGDPASVLRGDMDGLAVEWRYDPATGRAMRFSNGVAHDDAASGQVWADNVIVMSVEYRPSPADERSPEAQTIGSGDVEVFSRGTVRRGTWTRTDPQSPLALTATDGSPLALVPGRTWVELARPSTFTIG